MSKNTKRFLASFAIAALSSSSIPMVHAAAAGTAKGTLTLQGEKKSASIELTHAYLFVAPDKFDEKKTTRTIVFTTEDERAALEACADTSCAILSTKDGLTVELAEAPMANWWAHIAPTQASGTAAGALRLEVDTPDRLSGMFQTGGAGSPVEAAITFDAPLVKTFKK